MERTKRVTFDEVFERAKCEETGLVLPAVNPGEDDTVIPCGKGAQAVVLSERGKRLYFMCHEHADHNVKNRDCQLVSLKAGTPWRD